MKKPRILVVDDEPKLSELVRLFLEKTERFEVCVQNRPGQVLASAREFQPDMILLDVDMPGKDGGEVARDLKRDASLKDTPVLFFTSLVSTAEAGQHEIVKGGMRFLAKPINPRVLIDAIDRVLGRAPLQAA